VADRLHLHECTFFGAPFSNWSFVGLPVTAEQVLVIAVALGLDVVVK